MNNLKRHCFILMICLLAGCTSMTPQASRTEAYWPTQEWQSDTPEQQGMDSELLANMFQQVEDQQLNLHSLLIVRNGKLVTEAYFQPYTQNQPQYIASVTKSVIASLVGIAIQKGYIKDTDQTLVSFFPDQVIANLDEHKKSITLKHLLTLTAGLTCNDGPLSGESGMEQSSNWVQFMLDAPMTEQPGTRFNYCGGAVHLLSAILERTTGMRVLDFANQFLFEPLSISNIDETHWQKDPQGIITGPYGLYLTPRDMAKLGYLYLQNGQWGDQQIIPADWVKTATSSHTTKDNGLKYGYLWTIDPDQGSYSALGFAGQQIYVIPEKNLVVVFTGTLPSCGTDMDFLPLKALVDSYILPAVKAEHALPANKSAVTRINAFIDKAANPKQEAGAVPEGALKWSGVKYQLDPNPNQWETISFDIEKGAETVAVSINGQAIDPPIGLDHVYRLQQQTGVFAPTAMLGNWENENTLFVKNFNLGEINDVEIWVNFSAEEINLHPKSVANCQEMDMHGKHLAE